MKCLILAAGYATRLYPLTKDCPKPLVEVAHKPIIDRILEKVDHVHDIEHIFMVTNEKFLPHFTAWSATAEYHTPLLVCSNGTRSEGDRLGALGDIAFTIEMCDINDDLMIIGGDNLFEFSLERLVETFKLRRSHVVAARDIKNKKLATKFGVLSVNGEGQVTSFVEKPEDPPSTLIATLIYIFPKEKLHLISTYLHNNGAKDRAGDYLAWLYTVERLDALIFEEPWFDIGSFDQLEDANRFYLSKENRQN